MIDVRHIAAGLVGAVAILATAFVVDVPNAVWWLVPLAGGALAMALLSRDIPRGGRAPDEAKVLVRFSVPVVVVSMALLLVWPSPPLQWWRFLLGLTALSLVVTLRVLFHGEDPNVKRYERAPERFHWIDPTRASEAGDD
ncbi:MAG: hypothetical protein OEQ47_12325, partial [Acidimicrobiia bacterium]|nr:hypothetical protein [Acidimicrobiia bacterium]